MQKSLFVTFTLLLCTQILIRAQNLSFTSKLPLVFIQTDGKTITDNPRITAEMGIVWNGNTKTNHTSDPLNHFNGKITIEIRGSSSQMFPKKSYGFELIDSTGADKDFPLLGMPTEEDWILYAPYPDKSLIRNVLIFSLASQLGWYTPRCRLVELFINNTYQGVYVLMEKIKRDKNRVDIANLKPEDLAGDELTGGYIIKIDKSTGSGAGIGWNSVYTNVNGAKTLYQYEYPDFDEIQPAQKTYIKKYMDEFEKTMNNRNFDSVYGYRKYIDIPSFIVLLS